MANVTGYVTQEKKMYAKSNFSAGSQLSTVSHGFQSASE